MAENSQNAPPELTDSLHEAFKDAGERRAAQVIAEILHRHYPPPPRIPFWWAVTVNGAGGVANVYNLALSGRMGYVIHLHNLMGAGGEKLVMRAGGEILERYGLPRDMRLISSDRLAGMERDFAGNLRAFAG